MLGWGFRDCEVVHSAALSDDFSFHVAYAVTDRGRDFDQVRADEAHLEAESMTMDEVNDFIRAQIGRKVVVVGAFTGFDAHTVSIDAMLVSQAVTQKDVHVRNMTELIELLEAKRERGRFLCVAGGPRITN